MRTPPKRLHVQPLLPYAVSLRHSRAQLLFATQEDGFDGVEVLAGDLAYFREAALLKEMQYEYFLIEGG